MKAVQIWIKIYDKYIYLGIFVRMSSSFKLIFFYVNMVYGCNS